MEMQLQFNNILYKIIMAYNSNEMEGKEKFCTKLQDKVD